MSPGAPVEHDVVQQDAGPGLLATGTGRRVLAALLVVAAVLAAGDWQVRRLERTAVDRCATHARDTVADAEGELALMASYVGPALGFSPEPSVRRRLLEMVAEVAAPAAGPLREARSRCASVRVLPVHSALRKQRDDCLLLLRAEQSYLARVTEYGEAAFRYVPRPTDASCEPRRAPGRAAPR